MPVDVAGDARVVHDDDGTHVLVEQAREVFGVDAQRARLDVAEHQAGALSGEGERGAGEGERRHDHGVAGLEVEQHRGQLESCRARGGHQHLGGPGVLGQQVGGTARELAARRGVAAPDRLLDVVELATLHRGDG